MLPPFDMPPGELPALPPVSSLSELSLHPTVKLKNAIAARARRMDSQVCVAAETAQQIRTVAGRL
jgi:hypothetical protein